jgi:hypothetical protein
LNYTYRAWANTSPTYLLSSNTAQEETNQAYSFILDTYTNDIVLEYTYPADYPEQERAGKNEKTGAVLTRYVPDSNIQITRHETLTLADDGTAGQPITGQHIIQRAKKYTGKVNKGPGFPAGTLGPAGTTDSSSGSWNLRPSDYKRTWLCTGINADTSDHGASYNVTYTFAGREHRLIQGYTSTGVLQTRGAYGWDSHVVFVDPNT